jgi:hypothetical protein
MIRTNDEGCWIFENNRLVHSKKNSQPVLYNVGTYETALPQPKIGQSAASTNFWSSNLDHSDLQIIMIGRDSHRGH